ncbi:hypothetical protein ABAC460_17675 [Asticcacaulis sp. AC460]|uniref:four-helix bundle copper-binding protein n=1 Tax=Asticcacaulis sp. AC460 TaxID=1282360 RepID=UPI0003C404CB|nr:four-helix bundle copper-binding protein [Asticcacaulis sp. AC460]ESQ88022.1 hypothetical protein ABAC460_17675 [Asticcacaulis sp. AC460]
MPHDDARMNECIRLCWECRNECQTALYQHCLTMGGEHSGKDHVTLMADCIQACQTAADFMTRCSKLYTAECAACADVCDACALSCERIGGDFMIRCTEICRRCAQSCREMSKTMEIA